MFIKLGTDPLYHIKHPFRCVFPVHSGSAGSGCCPAGNVCAVLRWLWSTTTAPGGRGGGRDHHAPQHVPALRPCQGTARTRSYLQTSFLM